MTIKLELPCVELKVELPKELLEFDENQMQAKKDIELIIRDSGLKNYGEIGLPKPRE